MTTSMGPIMERFHEHLGAADLMMIKARSRFLTAARELREKGIVPPVVDQPELAKVRGGNCILPDGASWTQVMDDWVHCRTIELSPAQQEFAAQSGQNGG